MPAGARSHHRQGAREGSRDALPERGRHARRPEAAEARNRDGPDAAAIDAVVAATVRRRPRQRSRARRHPASAARDARCSIGAPLVTVGVIAGALLWQSQRTPALANATRSCSPTSAIAPATRCSTTRSARRSRVQLRQSPFLNLLPDQQVQATLRLMGRQPMDAADARDRARSVSARRRARRCSAARSPGSATATSLTLGAQDCVSGEVAGRRTGAGRAARKR